MEPTLDFLKQDIILSSKRGITILTAGALVLLIVSLLSLFLPVEYMGLVLFCGMGTIFPLGILLSKIFRIDIFRKNPLGVLGGLAAFQQVLFTPLFILLYHQHYFWLPMVVGIVAGSHFIYYAWLYNSKAYYFMTIATVAVATFAGLRFGEQSYTMVPLAMAAVYLLSIGWLFLENRQSSLQAGLAK